MKTNTMDKVIELTAIVVYKVDNVLYKTFGLVSPFRKQSWALRAKRLQRQLDYEHALRDHLNNFWGTNYTTKQALALHKD